MRSVIYLGMVIFVSFTNVSAGILYIEAPAGYTTEELKTPTSAVAAEIDNER